LGHAIITWTLRDFVLERAGVSARKRGFHMPDRRRDDY
jgi:hypothetical protein